MSEYELPYFGKLATENIEEYYVINFPYKEDFLQIDLNFESRIIDIKILDKIKNFIERIDQFDKMNRAQIDKDYSEDGEVKEFIVFHIEEIEDKLLELNIISDGKNKETQFLSNMKLARIGLYPDGKYGSDNFAVFDYTVNQDLTNQLIVLNTDENGVFDHISWES